MEKLCPESRSFLDPFCGSGTVLFEAHDKGCDAFGGEVNPAAWHLASLASFAEFSAAERDQVLSRLKALAAGAGVQNSDMFSDGAKPADLLRAIAAEEHPFIRKALASAVLLGMGDGQELTPTAIARGSFSTISILKEIKTKQTKSACYLADARRLSLDDSSVEAVVTSPPYINVFNYHQNYRPAAELLGWNPLEAARSEVGSNRKHRMNRFLTVTQYCIDMAQAILEMHRVLREGAPIVIVIGRTSNVLGTSFKNSAFIHELLSYTGNLVGSAERVFTNRYGERIYEDVLFTTNPKTFTIPQEDARAIGVAGLMAARDTVPEKSRSVLLEAIARAQEVLPSPFLSLTIPVAFSSGTQAASNAS
jgi:hypothetical protein